MQAQAKLQTGLYDLGRELDSREFITVKEAKEAIGDDLTKLPPEAQQMLDANDSAQVPMWVAASAIYRKKSADLMSSVASSGHLSGLWSDDFKREATAVVQAQNAQLAHQKLQEMDRWVVDTQKQSVAQILKTAQAPQDYELARSFIRTSSRMNQEEKQAMLLSVNRAEEVTPVIDALRKDSLPDLMAQRAKLQDPKQSANLTPDERLQYTDAIDRHVKVLEHEAKAKDEDTQKEFYYQNKVSSWSAMVAAKRDNAPISAISKLRAKPGTVEPEVLLAQDEYIKELMKPQPNGPPTPEQMAESLRVRQQLTEQFDASANPDGYRAMQEGYGVVDGEKVPFYMLNLKYRLEPADVEHFQNMRQSALGDGSAVKEYAAKTSEIYAAMAERKSSVLDPMSKDEETKQNVATVRERIETKWQMETQGNKPLTQARRTEIAKQVIDQYISKEKGIVSWFDSEKFTPDTSFSPDMELLYRELKVPEETRKTFNRNFSPVRDEVILARKRADPLARVSPGDQLRNAVGDFAHLQGNPALVQSIDASLAALKPPLAPTWGNRVEAYLKNREAFDTALIIERGGGIR